MKNVLYGKCVKCGKTYEATPDLTTCGIIVSDTNGIAVAVAVLQGISVTGLCHHNIFSVSVLYRLQLCL